MMCWLSVGRDLSFRSGDGRMVVARKGSEWPVCYPSKTLGLVHPPAIGKRAWLPIPLPVCKAQKIKSGKAGHLIVFSGCQSLPLWSRESLWPLTTPRAPGSPLQAEGRGRVCGTQDLLTHRDQWALWERKPGRGVWAWTASRARVASRNPSPLLSHLSRGTQWQGKEWKGILMTYCETCGNTKCSVNS